MKIRSRWLAGIAGAAGGAVFRGLARTLSIECVFEESFDPRDPDSPPMVYCLWHDALLPPLASRVRWKPSRPLYALVSQHRDGSLLTSFMRGVGVEAVRGSSRRGGAEALRRLMSKGKSGHVYITPDGPRGPRREIKPGILFLASQAELPIVPIGVAALNGWRVQGNWTDLLVPHPFSRCAVVFGKSLHIPAGLPKESLGSYQKLLTDEMGRVEQLAEGVVRGEKPTSYGLRLVA